MDVIVKVRDPEENLGREDKSVQSEKKNKDGSNSSWRLYLP